jgi:RimJ/RimL family protein N-acetyltransferase
VPGTTHELQTDRLVLTPLSVADANEMVGVLADSSLYSFTGGSAPDIEVLHDRYRAQVSGPAAGDEIWHNWIIRLGESAGAIGFVQATVRGDGADIAWVVAPAWQRRGYATEAARAMCEWLLGTGVAVLTAHIHPDHTASNGVAAAVGLHSTGARDDGEVIWQS